jgi:hypothetical protein
MSSSWNENCFISKWLNKILMYSQMNKYQSVTKKMLKYKPDRLKIDIGTDHSTLVGEFFKSDCCTHLIPWHGTQNLPRRASLSKCHTVSWHARTHTHTRARARVISLTPADYHDISGDTFNKSNRFSTALHADLLQKISPKSYKKSWGREGGEQVRIQIPFRTCKWWIALGRFSWKSKNSIHFCRHV